MRLQVQDTCQSAVQGAYLVAAGELEGQDIVVRLGEADWQETFVTESGRAIDHEIVRVQVIVTDLIC